MISVDFFPFNEIPVNCMFCRLFSITANPCGTMPVVLNGYIACPHNRAVFGATCVTRCNNGYRLSGSFFVSCDAMGVWSSVGSCKGNMLCLRSNFLINLTLTVYYSKEIM